MTNIEKMIAYITQLKKDNRRMPIAWRMTEVTAHVVMNEIVDGQISIKTDAKVDSILGIPVETIYESDVVDKNEIQAVHIIKGNIND